VKTNEKKMKKSHSLNAIILITHFAFRMTIKTLFPIMTSAVIEKENAEKLVSFILLYFVHLNTTSVL
jgi:hypothetical protein